jgi:hypothetical protein
MCLWCDISTHLGDQDFGDGTSHGHFLRRYCGFFFPLPVYCVTVCVVTTVLIYSTLKMKLFSNFLVPVSSVTVTEGTKLLRDIFEFF